MHITGLQEDYREDCGNQVPAKNQRGKQGTRSWYLQQPGQGKEVKNLLPYSAGVWCQQLNLNSLLSLVASKLGLASLCSLAQWPAARLFIGPDSSTPGHHWLPSPPCTVPPALLILLIATAQSSLHPTLSIYTEGMRAYQPVSWLQGYKQGRHSPTGPVVLPQWLGCQWGQASIQSREQHKDTSKLPHQFWWPHPDDGRCLCGAAGTVVLSPKSGDIGNAMGWWLSSSAWKMGHREWAWVTDRKLRKNGECPRKAAGMSSWLLARVQLCGLWVLENMPGCYKAEILHACCSCLLNF